MGLFFDMHPLPVIEWVHAFYGESSNQEPEVYCILATKDALYLAGRVKLQSRVDFGKDWGICDVKYGSANWPFLSKLQLDGNYIYTEVLSVSMWGGIKFMAYSEADDSIVAAIGNFGTGAILKLKPADGSVVWHYDLNVEPQAVAVSGTGDIYIVGYFSGTGVDFDPTAGTDPKDSNGSYDCFLSKYDKDGNYCWTKVWGGTSADYAYCVYVNTEGVYVVGSFQGNVDFAADWGETASKDSQGGKDGFVLKVTPSDEFGWVHTIGGSFDEEIVAVDGDSSGSIYVYGNFFSSDLNFASDWGKTAYTKNEKGVFIAKLVSGGDDFGWVRAFGPDCEVTVDSSGKQLAVNSSRIYLLGKFTSETNFGEEWGLEDYIEPEFSGSSFLSIVSLEGDYLGTAKFSEGSCASCIDAIEDGIFMAGTFVSMVNPGEWWGADFSKYAGTASVTNSVFFRLSPLLAPFEVQAVDKGTAVEISWKSSSRVGEGFRVYRTSDSGDVLVAQLEKGNFCCVDRPSSAGSFKYKVSAFWGNFETQRVESGAIWRTSQGDWAGIYPNVATAYQSIKFYSYKKCRVRIFDPSGRLVHKFEMEGVVDFKKNLPPGIYFVVFSADNDIKRAKIVILK